MPQITDSDPTLKALRKLFKRDAARKKGPPARKMSDICVAIKSLEKDGTVTSAMSAMVRGRLTRMIDDGTITRSGERASTTYSAVSDD